MTNAVAMLSREDDYLPLHTPSGLNRYNKDQIIPSLILALMVIFSVIATIALYSLQVQREAQQQRDLSAELNRGLSERTFYISQLAAQHLIELQMVIELLTKSPGIQNGDYSAEKVLLDSTKAEWSNDIDGIFIFNKDAVLSYTTTNSTQLIGTAYPNHITYISTKQQMQSIISPLTTTINGSLRIYVASPIIDAKTGQFKGTVAASILADTFAKSFERLAKISSFQNTDRSFALIDSGGRIIYTPSSQANVGKNILSDEILAPIPSKLRDGLVSSIKDGLAGKSGIWQISAEEIRSVNSTSTSAKNRPIDFAEISYSPIMVNNKVVMVAFLTESANLGIIADVNSQTGFLFLFIYIILGSMTAFGAAKILINRKLTKRVEAKSKELQESNMMLRKSIAENEDKARRLQEVDIQKGEFSAMITHELKTPLVAIIGYNSMLLKGRLGELSELQRQKLQVMFRNAERLTALIQDILDVQKLELGQLNIRPIEVSSKKIMEESISSLTPDAEARGIKILAEIDSDSIVKCDQDRIVQVLNNLISNAIKFSPDNATIVVRSSADANSAIFSVRDNGSGIPKEKQDKLFTKFYQVDTKLTRKVNGTGLGLVICKGIIEAHAGKIWFESIEGKGSLFSFSLPLEGLLEPKKNPGSG